MNQAEQVTSVTSDATAPVATPEPASEYGKFASAQALLDAYNALQAEFTKRCQRLCQTQRQLESLRQTLSNPAPAPAPVEPAPAPVEPAPAPSFDAACLQDDEFVATHILPNERIRQLIVNDYLTRLHSAPVAATTLTTRNGTSVLAPCAAPRSLADAKRIVDAFFGV